MVKAEKIQPKDTHGLRRSPITAAFRNSPENPSVLEFIRLGLMSRM